MPIKQETVRIENKLGLHARPATELAETAGKFESDIKISKNGRVTDAKSIMELMTLAATCGSELEITAQGSDADQALLAIKQLIHSKFNEE